MISAARTLLLTKPKANDLWGHFSLTACVYVLLEINNEELPHWEEQNMNWFKAFDTWAVSRRLQLIKVNPAQYLRGLHIGVGYNPTLPPRTSETGEVVGSKIDACLMQGEETIYNPTEHALGLAGRFVLVPYDPTPMLCRLH